MMCNRKRRDFIIAVLMTFPLVSFGSGENAWAADTDQPKTAGGLRVYLGIIPAEIVGEQSLLPPTDQAMHGGIPSRVHEYHLVTAIFDARSGERIVDATVTAQVSALNVPTTTKKLDLMERAGSPRYGSFFNLPTHELYTVKLTIERAADARPVMIEFRYDRR